MQATDVHSLLYYVVVRVIKGIQTGDIRNLFNPENIYISTDGGGAGNNWASGFTQGEAVQETLLDMIGASALSLALLSWVVDSLCAATDSHSSLLCCSM